MDPKVLLIIINYNGINFIGECLDSIFNQTYKNLNVLVVDNNSKDGSVKFIRNNYPGVLILENRENKGYGYAINKAVKFGIKKLGGISYFGILNNDLRLDDRWLENLVNYGQSKENCGILSGKMLIYYWPKYVNSTGSLVNYFGSGWDRDFFELNENLKSLGRESGEVLAVSGGAMLIKEKVFYEAGFFDKKYFMYYEDIDFCFRTWKFTDYTVDYVKDAIAYHKFSSSSGALSIKKHFYLKRSRFIFILKNYPLNFLRKIIPEITKYEFGFIMKDLLLRYDFINLWREFYIYLIFIAKFPLIIGSRLLKKDNRNKLRQKKAKRMWAMVSTTTADSGRKHIPMQYLDMLWNKYEKYGSETNRLVLGINDKGLGRGWKSLITKGYPRGRFFFNYADLLLTSPYRGENHKYYFQLQYFLYDKKSEELYVDLDGSTFKIKLKNGMHSINFEISHELLKDKSEVFIKLCFHEKFLKEISEYSSFFDGVMEKMDNNTFKEYTTNFKDLFVVEVSILSDDSQYLRNELAKID